MIKWFSLGFWELIARVVLRNRILMLSIIAAITVLLALQWKNIHFTQTEANMLPDDNIVNIEYKAFLHQFGEEGNLVVIGVKDKTFFTPKAFKSWTKLMNSLKEDKAVDLVFSINDLKKLQKNEALEKFELVPFVNQNETKDLVYLEKIKKELFNDLPFYEGLLLNKKSGTIRSAVYLDKKIVNTPTRKDFILNKLVPAVAAFEEETNIYLKILKLLFL
jgi:predicted RND superfamily exporter protein